MSDGLLKLKGELVMVQAQGFRHVGLLRRVHADFERLEDRWLGRLRRHFQNFGSRDAVLPPEHFKAEGRFPTGGAQSHDVLIYAFKAFQVRLYGPVIPLSDVATFVGIELVTDKKTDKANQELLRRVARRLGQYL